MSSKINKIFYRLLIIWPFVVFSQNTFIPDNNFEQALIDQGYDVGPILDNLVPTININSINELNIGNLNISDLTGIEDFVSLTFLDCTNNQLSILDLSENIELVTLLCSGNKMVLLNVSENIKLTHINCDNNQLAFLDVTKNIYLTNLVCNYNNISSLDVTQNTRLNILSCGDNGLSGLDVTQNSQLDYLWIVRNYITSLDVSQNTLLVDLVVSNNQLTSLDVSNNVNLTRLDCNLNQILILDLTNNTALTSFDGADNLLCSLDIRNNNNVNQIRFRTVNNPSLTCIFVDMVSQSYTNWLEIESPSIFVANESDCDDINRNYLALLAMDDVSTSDSSYVLQPLSDGNYYTDSGGNGTQLNEGDVITNSQTVYIYIEDSCRNAELSFTVTFENEDIKNPTINFDIPKFFTPNHDGIKDSWKIEDDTNSIHTISIYDRYGKLLKTFAANSNGWNGIYNGKLMESSDYWYVIKLIHGKKVKGHFSLKR